MTDPIQRFPDTNPRHRVFHRPQDVQWRFGTIRTKRFWLNLLAGGLVFASLYSFIPVAQAFPINQCPADRFGGNLGCTAQDVQLTGMRVVGDITSCVGGTTITLDLEMTVNFGTPDRWDIGVFISNDGKDPQIRAASGGAATCGVSVLPNSSPFLNLDGGATGDTCGDGNGSIGGGTGSGIHYMTDVTIACQSLTGAGGKLFVPFVVSWDNQKTSPGAVCTSNADPVPNTTSKCNAPTLVQGSIDVVVLPEITKTDGITTIFSGGNTTYNVVITNRTGATLGGAVFKDTAVTGITVNSVSCAAAGGGICPGTPTVAAMQGAGIVIPDMLANTSVTFTIGATLTGTPGQTRTNTATVTVSNQTNTASDTNTIVDTIAILPTTQSKNGDKGSTVTYTYTLYNFGVVTDTISLSAVSSKGWALGVSPTSVSVPAGGSTTVTLSVTIPAGATIGDVDISTITATSGINPNKTATANAVTTVTTPLVLTPSNTGSGGAGSSVYYSHRVENNASTSKSVSLTRSFTSGSCTGWTSALFETNTTTPLASPVTLAAYGGYKDFVLKITIPAGAAASSTCTATLTAQYTSGTPSTVSVTDVTTVKNLVLYEDTGYTIEQYVYPVSNNVYARGFGLISGRTYEYRWYNSSGAEVCTPRQTSTTGTIFPDTCAIPSTGPLGTWTVQIWDLTANPDVIFAQSNFYVGPDHLKASYSGANPAVTTNAVINLAMHDRANHVVPFDPSGNLVKGNPTDTEGPLMITVTVSGSATIVSTTLTNAVIVGQTVTGKLSSTTGTATLTITDTVAETVTITPASYKGLLYGSTSRDEPGTVTFVAPSGPNHYELSLASTSINCLPSTVTVTACADTSSPCTASLASVSGTTATLAASGGTLGVTTVTFNASGVATTTLSYPSAADGTAVTVTLSNEQTAATAARQCCQGGICAVANSCDTTFNTAGFIFSSAVNGAVATVPVQIAGKPSGTYYLRGVRTNTTTKACETALAGANAVDFAYECNNPTTCTAANLTSVNGGTATTIQRNDNGAALSYTPVNMTFDADGNAPFTFNYSDAGQVKLHARKTVNSATLLGETNAFVVRPFGFRITDPPSGRTGATSTVFTTAGTGFNTTLTAVVWEVADDADNDGVPDSQGAALSGNAATFNFGRETTPATATLSHALAEPVASTNTGSLAGSPVFSGFTNGTKTQSVSFTEVGIIRLRATTTNYLGSGQDVTAGPSAGGLIGVGRFIPHHFDVTKIDGCTGATFTYSGQPFTAMVVAKNAFGGPLDITKNYDGTLGFAKAVTISNSGSTANLSNNTIPASGAGEFGSGQKVQNNITYTYPVASKETAAASITLRAMEDAGNDNVSSAGYTEEAAEIRSGRLRLINAYGSELATLSLPMWVEYYTSDGWVKNTTDTCTSLGVADLDLSNAVHDPAQGVATINIKVSPNFPSTVSVTSPFAGVGALNFTAPSAEGYADARMDLPARTWLRFDWDDDGTTEDDPVGRATFGLFRGSPKHIYQRERY